MPTDANDQEPVAVESTEIIQLPRGAKVASPEAYRGVRAASAVENWIFSIQCYTDTTGITDSQAVKFAATCLRDDAILWWQQYSLSPDAPLVDSWSAFTGALPRVQAWKLSGYCAPTNACTETDWQCGPIRR
ncbi:hypothetical protein INT43_005063 [Umbelopsis isabellina]|uniref:Retrotransposon gag domain-containing protein n=1 Tax=Mortierella isabellina TaxID=91625 RepID=A0A8H7U8R6_MORIS|nr:hypothetical protein INT43_005063 [Umbelopsis isabellina]